MFLFHQFKELHGSGSFLDSILNSALELGSDRHCDSQGLMRGVIVVMVVVIIRVCIH